MLIKLNKMNKNWLTYFKVISCLLAFYISILYIFSTILLTNKINVLESNDNHITLIIKK